MILGLNGLKGSGKDTVGAHLIKEHGFERRSFADPLKKSVAALLDIPYHEIDKWKNDPQVYVNVTRERLTDDTHTADGSDRLTMQGMTFREFLQRYATESHREIFGEDFWLDYTMPIGGFYSGKNIVITDMRFDNEAVRIRSLGGYRVFIARPGLDDKDQHSSEQGVSPGLIDYHILNDGTLIDLEEKVEEMLEQLGTVDSRIKMALRDE